jgi:hypothetical protein
MALANFGKQTHFTKERADDGRRNPWIIRDITSDKAAPESREA